MDCYQFVEVGSLVEVGGRPVVVHQITGTKGWGRYLFPNGNELAVDFDVNSVTEVFPKWKTVEVVVQHLSSSHCPTVEDFLHRAGVKIKEKTVSANCSRYRQTGTCRRELAREEPRQRTRSKGDGLASIRKQARERLADLLKTATVKELLQYEKEGLL